MPYKLDDKKVLLAIDLIIKDVDKKYDECLVEHFLEFIGSQPKEDGWLVVIKRLNSFMEHKAFVMFNQARTFKIISRLLAVSYPIQEEDFKTLSPTLNNVWNSMDMVILNKNWSALTLIMSIFENLIVAYSHGFDWLMDRVIDPPVKIQDYLIDNLISSLRYCLEVCNNYHTRNKAEQLLASLILQLQNSGLPSHHAHVITIRDTTRELVSRNSISMLTIIVNSLSQNTKDRDHLIEILDLTSMLDREFLAFNQGKNLNCLIKCLAMTNSQRNFHEHIETLKSRRDVGAIITYLSHSFNKDDESYRLLLVFILYPILTCCRGKGGDELIEKLRTTEDEIELIDSATKLIPLCLSQLRHIDLDTKQAMLGLVFDTLICYVRCHVNDMKSYRNVMECCNLFEVFASKFDIDDASLVHKLVSKIHEVIDDLDETDHKKPILIKLLKLPENLERLSEISQVRPGLFLDKWMLFVLKFKDHDVMNELAELSRVKMYSYQPENDSKSGGDEQEQFWRLVWQNMYLKYAKQTDHRELLGNITHLLIMLDRFAPAAILAEFGLERFINVPIILGDILIEQWAVTPIVTKTIDALSNPTNKSYFACLPLKCLEHISNGLLSASRGELGENVIIKAHYILEQIPSVCLKSDEVLNEMKQHPALEEKSEFSSKMELSSLVDDILNYELISDGISDCY